MKIKFVGSVPPGCYQAFGLPTGGALVAGSTLEAGRVPSWLPGLPVKQQVRFLIDGIRADKWLAKNVKPEPPKPAPKPKPAKPKGE